MVIKQRAISSEQKEERRRAILSAAWQMYRETSYEAVNIAQVAKKAGIAKGTVYLYFKTKEELFLALLAREFEAWFNEVQSSLENIRAAQGTCTIDDFVDGLAATLENRSTLIRLLAISHAVLEQNINFETAFSFKRALLNRMAQIGVLLESVLPFLHAGDGMYIVVNTYVLMMGVQHLAEPAPIVQRVIKEKNLAALRVEFMDYFLHTLRIFLRGIEASRVGPY